MASAFWVHPGPQYVGYIDWRVLGIFAVADADCGRISEQRTVRCYRQPASGKDQKYRAADAGACFLCFFSSMFITNDVAHFDVCAVCVHDPAEMPPGAADCDNVCAADACAESGEHADAGRESAESVSFTASPVPGWVNLSDGWRRIRSCQVCFCACRVRAQCGQAPDLAGDGGTFADVRSSRQEEKRDLSGALCAKPAFGSAGASVGS